MSDSAPPPEGVSVPPTCHTCHRPLAEGESAWASDWTVIDGCTLRYEVRHTCDDCEAKR